jgi:hypothetical protein
VTSIVFDSTALIHFARADRLTELQNASANDEPILLAEVERELASGTPLPGQVRGPGSTAPDRAGLWAPAPARRGAPPGVRYPHSARKTAIRA